MRQAPLLGMSLSVLFGVSGLGLCVLTAQQPAPSGGFTAAQAEAGHKAYESTCGKCHTYALTGRKGNADELPPLNSLPADYQEMVKKYGGTPPLKGPAFLNGSGWGARTTAELTSRFQEAVGGFPPEGTNDETAVNITAYVLLMNGAKPGTEPLTKTTSVTVNSLVAQGGSLAPAAK